MTDPLRGLPPGLRDRVAEGRPRFAAPMLATLTQDRFSDPEWIYERKLDGVRCLAVRDGADVRLWSRNEKALTGYPEVADAIAAQRSDRLVLDGEVVAFEGRRTSFSRLQGRLGLADPDEARASGIAVFYYVFDVLHVDGRDLDRLPLTWRKRVLRRAVDFSDPLRFTTHRVEHGEEAFRRACARGDEGVVAKRASGAYRHGRSPDWLKFKCVRDQEFVVAGWTAPQGSRVGLGALVLGYHERGRLVYAGRVGTGFDERTLRMLHDRLTALGAAASPFAQRVPHEGDVHWVAPELVVQIGFSEWTRDGLLRHPRYEGLREDKAAADVVRETR